MAEDFFSDIQAAPNLFEDIEATPMPRARPAEAPELEAPMPRPRPAEADLDEDDAFSRAARRQRQAVQPPGGRTEGTTTKVLENYLPHVGQGMLDIAKMPGRAMEEGLTPEEEITFGGGVGSGMLGLRTPGAVRPASPLGWPQPRPKPSTPEEMAAFRQRAEDTAPPRPSQAPEEPPLGRGERGPAWREEMDRFTQWREAYDAGRTQAEFWEAPQGTGDKMGFGEIRPEAGMWNVYRDGVLDNAFATRQDAADYLRTYGFAEPRRPAGARPEAEPSPGPQPGPEPQAQARAQAPPEEPLGATEARFRAPPRLESPPRVPPAERPPTPPEARAPEAPREPELPFEEPPPPRAAPPTEPESPRFFDDIAPEEPPARVTEPIPEEAMPAGERPFEAPEAAETSRAPPEEPSFVPPQEEGRRQNLFQHIAQNGGISASDPLIADVRSVIGKKNLFIPGYGALIRKGGKPLDQVLTNAIQERYIEDPGWWQADRQRTSTIPDLIDAMSEGGQRYPVGQEAPAARPVSERQVQFRVKQIEDAAREIGLTREDLDLDALYDAAKAAVTDDRTGLLDLYDQALAARTERDAQSAGAGRSGEAARPPGGPAGRPGGEAPLAATRAAASGAGAPAQPPRQKGTAPEAVVPNVDSRVQRQAMAREGFRPLDPRTKQRLKELGYKRDAIEQMTPAEARVAMVRGSRGPEPGGLFEAGVEGKPQQVIPGAQQDVAGMLQRRAEAPLKPKVAQKPTDIGLFGDEGKQLDIFGRPSSKLRREGERGRDARPIRTRRVKMDGGVNLAILEQGYARATGPRGEPRGPALEAMLRDAGNESISDKLLLHNYPKLSQISGYLGGTKINPTLIRVALQDKSLRVRRLQEQWARDNPGKILPENMDTYMAESLSYGVKDKLLRELRETYSEKLLNEMKKRNVDWNELGDYAYALHALERNAEIRKINPNIPDPSGMSDAEATAIINQVRSGNRRADFDVTYDLIRKMVDATLWLDVKYGLIAPEAALEWQQKWPNYVPLRHTEVGEGRVGTGKGMQVKGKEYLEALGRRSRAENPIAFAMEQMERAAVRGVNNEVGQTLGRFVQANPEPDLWTFNTPTKIRYRDPSTGMVVEINDPNFRNREDVFVYKDVGKEQYIHFIDPTYGKLLVRAMKNLGTAEMNSVVRFISGLTRGLARLSTSWNPDFMIPNLFRDAGEAILNLQENEKKGFSRRFAKHLIPSLYGALRGQQKGQGYYAQQFREMETMGGRIGYLGMEQATDISKSVQRQIARLQGGALNKTKDVWDAIIKTIDEANNALENGTRTAVYISAKEVGFTPKKSASIAREATINFNRKGELGTYASMLWMFSNPILQSPVRTAKALKSKRARRGAYALAAASAGLAIYNQIAGGDNEDGRSNYEANVPSWERDRNFVIMHPDGSAPTKIPAPFGFMPFKIFGDHLASWMMGFEKGSKARNAMLLSLVEAGDPFGADRHSPLAHFMPSLLKPGVYVAENKDAFGRPIYPDEMPWNKYLPESGRAFRSASTYAKKTAESVNELTGGTKKIPGEVDVHPGTLDFLMGYYTGGLGRFAKNGLDTILRGSEGREWLPEKTPIVRRFVGSEESPGAAKRSTFFEELKEVQAAKQRETPGPEWTAEPAFKKALDQRKSILKQVDTLNTNDAKLSPAVIDQRVKALREQELKVMFQARKALEAARAASEKRPRAFAEGGEVEDEDVSPESVAQRVPMPRARPRQPQDGGAGPQDWGAGPQDWGAGVEEGQHDRTSRRGLASAGREYGQRVWDPNAGKWVNKWRHSPREVLNPAVRPSMPAYKGFYADPIPSPDPGMVQREYQRSLDEQDTPRYPVYASGGVVNVDSSKKTTKKKATKASVNYSKGMKSSHCGICAYYRHGTCTKVKGHIESSMWCRLFAKGRLR